MKTFVRISENKTHAICITKFERGLYFDRFKYHVLVKIFDLVLVTQTFQTPIWFHNMKDSITHYAKRLSYVLNPFPVYYVVEGTDCDGYGHYNTYRAPCGNKYLKSREAAYDYADGPTSVYRISKEEYNA